MFPSSIGKNIKVQAQAQAQTKALVFNRSCAKLRLKRPEFPRHWDRHE